jgi:hypothetical protein
MGKVGSRSVEAALDRKGIAPLHHTHQLNPAHVRALNRQRRDDGRPERDPSPMLRLYETLVEPQKRSKYITLVRDPVSRNVSAFFQNIDRHLVPSPYEEMPEIPELVDYFLKEYDHEVPLKWFQREPKETLNIDVYKKPFPKERGVRSYSKGPFDMLVLKCEISNKKKENAINSFLNISNISIGMKNKADDKSYSKVYKKVKSKNLPKNYVDKMCKSRYARHFYTEREISDIYDFWT